ncbi:MAG: hypothetical protein Q7R34_11090 [Dehalococcoidia bacterium]|nr:hypothetical protein [Dehalococcoidia bacterium]
MATEQQDDKGTMDDIKDLFLRGHTQKEIVDKGYAKATVSEVKQEMETRGDLPSNGDNRKLVPVRGLSLEAIVQNIEVPNVNCRDFKKTVKFVLDFMVLGVRLAQELSTMGVQQGRPLIEMAKEMRQAEGQLAQAAQQAGADMVREAAHEAAAGVGQQVVQAMKQQAVVQSPNPMMAMMVDAIRPQFTQMMGNVMGTLMRQPAQPGQTNPPPAQTKPTGNGISVEEIKEVFGNDK